MWVDYGCEVAVLFLFAFIGVLVVCVWLRVFWFPAPVSGLHGSDLGFGFSVSFAK